MNWEKILKICDVKREITTENRRATLVGVRDKIGMVCLHALKMATPRTRAAIYQMHLLILFLFFGSKKFWLRVNGWNLAEDKFLCTLLVFLLQTTLNFVSKLTSSTTIVIGLL